MADTLSLIEAARRRSGLKLEYLAHLSGVKSKGQLSAALSGVHGVSFNVTWLDAWPAEFWNEFIALVRSQRESSDEAKRLQKKERALLAIAAIFDEVAS